MADPQFGSIGWVDLTVADAPKLRDFYARVVGWKTDSIPMSGYEDFVMKSADGEGVAGVCHARGVNANLPPVWMLYIVVENIDIALEQCRALGGEVVTPVRTGGGSRFAVIKDPAGAHCALYEPAAAA